MRIHAQQINSGRLLVVGSPLRSDLGIVVDLDARKTFHKWSFQSILARGYWGDVTASDDEQKEAIRLARIQAKKPLLRRIPIKGDSDRRTW